MSFKQFLNEASLMGNSRSGGMPNWDYYVSSNFDASKEWDTEKGGELKLYNDDFSDFEMLLPNQKLKILDPELTVVNKKKYAKVEVNGTDGYLHINSIKKQIANNKNSKEFTPDKLELAGVEYSSVDYMASNIIEKLKKHYGKKEHEQVRRYLIDIINTVANTNYLSEKVERFTDIVTVPTTIDQGQLKIISKNFGELVGALYLLKTNSKLKSVGFPLDIKEPLYDFYGIDKRGMKILYSVKSGGGSSTSLNNINFILDKMKTDNTLFKELKDEIYTLSLLMNTKGRTTVGNIVEFFESQLPDISRKILTHMSQFTPVTSFESNSLDLWLDYVRNNVEMEDFVELMEDLYSRYFKKASSTRKVLQEIFNGKKNFHHGYLLYPMGSHIVSILNDTPKYVDALNALVNTGSFISQTTVTIIGNDIKIEIIPFSKNKFRFSYNAMSKAPGNRPIGFQEA